MDVGVSHLVPAYAKYDWNWIQYYDIDVYLLLGTLLGLILYISFSVVSVPIKGAVPAFRVRRKQTEILISLDYCFIMTINYA